MRVCSVPRATFGLDILVDPTVANAKQLLTALQQLGFGTAAEITPEELVATQMTRLKDRILIDGMTKAPGIEFAKAWQRREQMEFEGQMFFVVSRDDLIAAKRAAGRPRDLEDLTALNVS